VITIPPKLARGKDFVNIIILDESDNALMERALLYGK